MVLRSIKFRFQFALLNNIIMPPTRSPAKKRKAASPIVAGLKRIRKQNREDLSAGLNANDSAAIVMSGGMVLSALNLDERV